MKTAVPVASRPRPRVPRTPPPPGRWEADISAVDRAERRNNRGFKCNVVRLDLEWVALIASDRTLPLEELNRLPPTGESSDEAWDLGDDDQDVEADGDLAIPAEAA